MPVAAIQQRIVRAKKTPTAAKVPFEVPEPTERVLLAKAAAL